MNQQQKRLWLLVVTILLPVVLAGCPKIIRGSTVRIVDIDPTCRYAVLYVVAFQGNNAIGNFDMEVSPQDIAEFVIPQALAQRIDLSQPVKLRVTLKDKKSAPECFLVGRTLVFTGMLTQKGTDPRTGNPVYVLNFWEDFKIEYR